MLSYAHLGKECFKLHVNPLKPEFTIVIFIHYKPQNAVAANGCRNSRIVVDEDDLKRVTNEKKIILLKQFHENVCSKTPSCNTLGDSLDMQNYALMHREGLISVSRV